MVFDLDKNVQYIKGVGPVMAKLFAKMGIFTVRDLIYYFPRNWEDRTNITKISSLIPNSDVLIRATIKKVIHQKTNSGYNIIKALVCDETGSVVVSWFNQMFVKKNLEKNLHKEILISGKADFNQYSKVLEISVRDYEFIDQNNTFLRIAPKYPLTEGLYQKKIREVIRRVFDESAHKIMDPLPKFLLHKYSLPPLRNSIIKMHFPDQISQIELNRKRLAFDDFFMLQLALAIRRKRARLDGKGTSKKAPHILSEFEKILPFKLTNAQKRVLSEIEKDMADEKPMNRLIQGDVGSGKTVVAVGAALISAACGYQSAIMVPTEILAKQHFEKIKNLLAPLNIKVHLLTGSEKISKKKIIKKELMTNEPGIFVGTHALISENVVFSNLGLVVIDEQHRFGVAQRIALKQKGFNPDLLVMTATPIPRTLSLTLYGDLDKSIIDELPPGRGQVITKYVSESKRKNMYEFIRQKVKEGRQVYVVCPLIEESEKIDLAAAKETAENLSKIFSEFNVKLVHGKMKSAEKDEVMSQFKDGKINILVSTTVIEVGIDVPNAVIMIIEHVERFGLSQLHQLRGRIGRGSEQSYCFLLGNPITIESKERIKAMLSTTDGFKIAEADLKLRGPGEVLGVRQSGIPEFKIADLSRDEDILKTARQAAFELVSIDPDLNHIEHALLKTEIQKRFSSFLGEGSFN